MAFTYPPNNGVPGTLDGLSDVNATTPAIGQSLLWTGTEWIASGPLGSLISPQNVVSGGPNLWLPRVNILSRNNSAAPLRDGKALPLVWNQAVRLSSIKIPFFNNTARTGTQPWGELFANPGWQVKAYIYSASVSGLPTTLLRTTNLATINNTTDGGASQGTLTLSFTGPNYLDVAANTVIWVAIVSQPLFVAEFPTGWNPNDKYVYNAGVWSVDNATGAYLTSPSNLACLNQLAPISSLPEVPWLHQSFGFPFGSNSLYYQAPIWDFDGAGAGAAVNLSTWAGHTTWPAEQQIWPTGSGITMTFPYAPTGDSTVFYAEGALN